MTGFDRNVCAAVGLLYLSACGAETLKEEPDTTAAKSPPMASVADADGGGSIGASVTSARASAPVAAANPSSQASAGSAAPPAMTMPMSMTGMTGTAGASGAPAVDPACATLRPCCGTLLDAREKQLCQAIVDQRTASLCKVASEDYCAAPTTTSTTMTTMTTMTVPSMAECTALNTCCASLDEEDQEDCLTVVDTAIAADCSASLTELCPNTAPATTPTMGVCAMLDTMCCATLEDDEDIEECKDAVSSAIEATCQETLDALCGADGDD